MPRREKERGRERKRIERRERETGDEREKGEPGLREEITGLRRRSPEAKSRERQSDRGRAGGRKREVFSFSF